MRMAHKLIDKQRDELHALWLRGVREAPFAEGLSPSEVASVMLDFLLSLGRGPIAAPVHLSGAQHNLIEHHLSNRLRQGATLNEILSEFAALHHLLAALFAAQRTQRWSPSARDAAHVFGEIHQACIKIQKGFSEQMLEDEQPPRKHRRHLEETPGQALLTHLNRDQLRAERRDRASEAEADRRTGELEREYRRLSELLGTLNHDLRSPVASAVLGLEVLGSTTDKARREEIRVAVLQQTKRITRQLDGLLDVSHVLAGDIQLDREPVDLVAVAAAARPVIAPLLEEGERVLTEATPPPSSALVWGDEFRLTQVVEHLLKSAVKRTEEGGRIWLDIEPDDDTILIRVRDDGIARAKGDMGLGSALVRGLVEMHGGSVTSSSAGLGRGNELVVALPRLSVAGRTADHEDEPPGPGESPSPEDAAPARRILVVDDERHSREALAELLGLDGHEVVAVRDARTALEVMSSFRPEAALLDIGLPEMNGYELARRIRAQGDDGTLLIALTGYAEDRARLDASGFDGHLIKPPDLARLEEYLKEAGRAEGLS